MIGAQRAVTADVTIGTYATNGIAYTPAQFGLNRIDYINFQSTGGYLFETDYTNKKVKARWQTDPADTGGADVVFKEVANSTNMTAVVARALVIGV